MSNVTLCFGGKQKRALIPNSFEELEAIIRKKFPDIPEGKIDIKATVTDGNTYDIENDMDLEDLGRDGIKALSIQSQSSQFTSSIVVAGTRYQVDEIPNPEDQIVQQMLGEINQDGSNIDLKEKLAQLCQVVDLLQLTAIAANEPGAGLQFLETGAYDLIVFMTELSHDADVFYTKCKTQCSSVTSTVMIAVAFLSDGFDDSGIRELATLGETSRAMGEKCRQLVTKVEAGLGNVKKVITMLGEAVKSQKENLLERKSLQTDKRKQELSVEGLTRDLQEVTVGAAQRRERSEEVAGSLRAATAGVATSTAAVAGLLATGIRAGTLAMTMPVVGVPLALLTATGTLLYGFNRQVSDTNVQQKEDENVLALRRREEVEARKKLLDLARQLDKLTAVNVEYVLECLHLVKGDLVTLHSTLLKWKSFWDVISDVFFQSQQDKEEKFVSMKAEELEGDSSNQKFKEGVIKYLARWVALREHCIDSQTAIKANIEPLHRLIKRNPTRAEAEEELRKKGRQICTDLAIGP